MTFLVSRSQNKNIFTFLMALNRHSDGYILKELLLPFIKKNYIWVTVHEMNSEKYFEENKRYAIHTLCGYTLPSCMSVNIRTIRTRRSGTFVSFFHKQKYFTKKVKTTFLGNQMVKFDKYYISGGSKFKKLLYTRDYVSLVTDRKFVENNI